MGDENASTTARLVEALAFAIDAVDGNRAAPRSQRAALASRCARTFLVSVCIRSSSSSSSWTSTSTSASSWFPTKMTLFAAAAAPPPPPAASLCSSSSDQSLPVVAGSRCRQLLPSTHCPPPPPFKPQGRGDAQATGGRRSIHDWEEKSRRSGGGRCLVRRGLVPRDGRR